MTFGRPVTVKAVALKGAGAGSLLLTTEGLQGTQLLEELGDEQRTEMGTSLQTRGLKEFEAARHWSTLTG